MTKNQIELAKRWTICPLALDLLRTDSPEILFAFYNNLVQRHVPSQAVVYTCGRCSNQWTLQKYEELPECGCGGFASVFSTSFKKYKTNININFLNLLNDTKIHLTNLSNLYHNNKDLVEIEKVGMTSNGYYLKFTGGEMVYSTILKNVVLKAALMIPFLWDFKFKWEKFNVPQVSILSMAEISLSFKEI